MTEESTVNVQSEVAPVDTTASAPVEQAPAEKMLPQSQVSKIAAREAREAAEKTRQEMEKRFEQERAQLEARYQQQYSGSSNVGGMTQLSEQDIQRLIREQAMAMSHEHQALSIAQQYESKIKAAMHSDPEFADLYDELGIDSVGEMVVLVNSVDNTAAVVKDLAKNPEKYAQILMLAKSGSQGAAQKMLHRLSESIKANEQAKSIQTPSEPLSQLKPSIGTSTSDGMPSVSDLRKRFSY